MSKIANKIKYKTGSKSHLSSQKIYLKFQILKIKKLIPAIESIEIYLIYHKFQLSIDCNLQSDRSAVKKQKNENQMIPK